MKNNRRKHLNAKCHDKGIKRLSKKVKTKLRSADTVQKKADGIG